MWPKLWGTGNELQYMIPQFNPASTRVCRGCHRGATAVTMAGLSWKEKEKAVFSGMGCAVTYSQVQLGSRVTLGTTLD